MNCCRYVRWHSAIIFRKADYIGPQPNWNGVVESITTGCRYPEESTSIMLPLINLDPGD